MTRPATLAFDVYGTLIDTAGVTGALEQRLGAGAAAFAEEWRRKQLEYTFRYGAMRQYRDFRACTRQALEYCCELLRADFSAQAREELMAQYLRLPAFPDVAAGLEALSRARMRMFAFSNGHPQDLEPLLVQAGLRGCFAGIVSVHDVSSFKPDPAVYHHFLRHAEARAEDCWLISGNPFDICGARAAGWHALWLRRNPRAVFDPWEFAPEHEAATFAEVADFFLAQPRR
ncbi:MAG: haloacid dehalogenase type II [Gammaproteobacteria bacterium]